MLDIEVWVGNIPRTSSLFSFSAMASVVSVVHWMLVYPLCTTFFVSDSTIVNGLLHES